MSHFCIMNSTSACYIAVFNLYHFIVACIILSLWKQTHTESPSIRSGKISLSVSSTDSENTDRCPLLSIFWLLNVKYVMLKYTSNKLTICGTLYETFTRKIIIVVAITMLILNITIINFQTVALSRHFIYTYLVLNILQVPIKRAPSTLYLTENSDLSNDIYPLLLNVFRKLTHPFIENSKPAHDSQHTSFMPDTYLSTTILNVRSNSSRLGLKSTQVLYWSIPQPSHS